MHCFGLGYIFYWGIKSYKQKKEKRRVKNGKGIKVIIVLVVVIALVVIGGLKIKNVYDGFMDEYKGTESASGTDVTIEIPEGASSKKAAAILHDAGLIKYEYAFVLRVKESEYRGRIQPGTFTLNTGMSTLEMIEDLCYVEPVKEVVDTLTIPEGYSIEQIAAKCEEHGICSADEFLNEVKNGNHQIPFSTGDMNTDGVKYDLQGYLFPATYDIYDDTTAASLIDTMLEKFQSIYTSEYSAKAAELGYTDYQILIMASIVEREAKIDSERPIIAGVIYNRLNIDMMLQMCPTVLYPLTDGMYDKTEVTYDDLEIESPYNTYRNTGLPVGPICNPGQASLEAVLYPDENDYLYYHTSDAGDGSHIFSSTYDEHINTQ